MAQWVVEDSGVQGPLSAVLTDDVFLPGETHVITAHWDEEVAVLAALPGADGLVVVLPRAVHHSDARPAIGVLAVADAVGSDDFGQVQRARLFGLKRIEVRCLSRRGVLLVVEISEIDEGEATEADLGRLLRLARRAARSESLGSRSGLSPELGEKSPSQLADALAVELGASDEARLTLLGATKWVDRLPILEQLAKPRRTRLRSPRARRPRSSEAADEQLPPEIRRAVENCLDEPGGATEAPGRVAARVLRELVWEAPPAQPVDLARARQLLNDSHAGLAEAKRAILDHLVVLEWQRQRGIPPSAGHALCLVGPPGTGKTTLAAKVAEAMGRRLERIPLGGVDDVSLVGSDRAYRHSQPGEIVRRLRAAQVHPSQVVWLLDEIDKASRWSDHTAIPVLLALLDPSQNSAWQDRFLDGVCLDLSGSMFMATANELDGIPSSLRDRLRCVEVPGYSSAEQIQIGVEKLLPKLLSQLGADGVVEVAESALGSLVLDHPRTVGCRQLEQRLQVVLARALELHMDGGGQVTVDAPIARAWVPPERSSGIGFQWQARLDSVAVAPGALSVGVGD
ncbi:MAG: AAA family ATPase [Candidatus Dormibacteraeota bacterium]|jgi:MoxR-like ATPase|nr:AAA family ATPase [Candidatus Dormibacteraeota bacterium]